MHPHPTGSCLRGRRTDATGSLEPIHHRRGANPQLLVLPHSLLDLIRSRRAPPRPAGAEIRPWRGLLARSLWSPPGLLYSQYPPMNFIYRTAVQPVAPELPRIPEDGSPKPATTLEGLIIAEDSYQQPSPTRSEDGAANNGPGDIGTRSASLDSKSPVSPGTHTDVAEDEGCITIPYKSLPDNWNDVLEMAQLQPLDRSFLFPGNCVFPVASLSGEQVRILACLSASQQDIQAISPFRIAAVMSKNGNSLQQSPNKSSPVKSNGHDNGATGENGFQDVDNDMQSVELNGEASPSEHDILETQSRLQMEDHKQQIELMLRRFRESNFFVRIAESDEPLWSKRKATTPKMADGRSDSQGNSKASKSNLYNAISDKGIFDGSTSGGVARDTVKCYSLRNGDIVHADSTIMFSVGRMQVVLQVNVGVNKLEDPVLEILQFEKSISSSCMPENLVDGLSDSNDDPCRELLSWLLPLDRTLPPRSLAPPTLNPSISHKQSAPGSQIFNFRSYSMPTASSIQTPNNIRPPPISESQEFMPEKPAKPPDIINDGQLSFRGVPLEAERYSVRCGLEGVYLPGKRWRRKVEIIQPIEVHSFAAKCTVENLLCVTVKNIAPTHAKDIVVFIDAITIVFEEASKGGAPLSLPIASIEVGHGHSLPNLALRRGEEHSFILKPATMSSRERRTNSDAPLALSLPTMTGAALNTTPKVGEPYVALSDQYAVLVSYRCNYTVVSLNSAPATPNGSFDGVNESAKRCVPPRSSTTVKLELLPLSDGIITLDTLQITAREKGLTYIPEQSLEIHATSGISS
nr:unnamed protein product [Digitaria exilis]